VLIVTGGSARMAEGCKDRPVDTAIIGVVDAVRLDEQPAAAAAGASKR
jgi:microcompartment protein CcmK/EutM